MTAQGFALVVGGWMLLALVTLGVTLLTGDLPPGPRTIDANGLVILVGHIEP